MTTVATTTELGANSEVGTLCAARGRSSTASKGGRDGNV
jgi:hypothetical protein